MITWNGVARVEVESSGAVLCVNADINTTSTHINLLNYTFKSDSVESGRCHATVNVALK